MLLASGQSGFRTQDNVIRSSINLHADISDYGLCCERISIQHSLGFHSELTRQALDGKKPWIYLITYLSTISEVSSDVSVQHSITADWERVLGWRKYRSTTLDRA